MADGRRGSKLIALVAAGALLAVGGIASAAGGKLDTVKKTVEIEDGLASGKAKCASGKQAVSGGFAAQAADATVYLEFSQPAGKRAWKSALPQLLSTPGEVNLYAYCRDQKLSVERVGSEVATEGTKQVTAKCPPGTIAVSGGPRGPVFDGLLPHVSKRVGDRKWRVVFTVFDEGVARAAVKCAKNQELRKAEKTIQIDAPGYQHFRVKAKCRKDERVLSGGFSTDEPVNKGISFYEVSKRAGKRGWKVGMGTAGTQELTAYAYCEPA